jgi:hypothetical protein
LGAAVGRSTLRSCTFSVMAADSALCCCCFLLPSSASTFFSVISPVSFLACAAATSATATPVNH